MIRSSMAARRLPALLVAAALALAACESRDPVLLKLDGEEVRRSDFERHLSAVAARGLGPIDPAARRGLLEAFLEERALVITARRRSSWSRLPVTGFMPCHPATPTSRVTVMAMDMARKAAITVAIAMNPIVTTGATIGTDCRIPVRRQAA